MKVILRNAKTVFVTAGLLLVLSLSFVGAAQLYVTCQATSQTGHGYYKANCSGKNVVMTCYYDDSSESWAVNNYTGTNADRYKNCVGVSAGKRNGVDYWDVGCPFNQYGHIHHFTTNRI